MAILPNFVDGPCKEQASEGIGFGVLWIFYGSHVAVWHVFRNGCN